VKIGILLLVFGYIVMILVDFRGLVNSEKKLRTMSVYFTLVTIGFTISILQIIQKEPPSPAIFIEGIVRSIFY